MAIAHENFPKLQIRINKSLIKDTFFSENEKSSIQYLEAKLALIRACPIKLQIFFVF